MLSESRYLPAIGDICLANDTWFAGQIVKGDVLLVMSVNEHTRYHQQHRNYADVKIMHKNTIHRITVIIDSINPDVIYVESL